MPKRHFGAISAAEKIAYFTKKRILHFKNRTFQNFTKCAHFGRFLAKTRGPRCIGFASLYIYIYHTVFL